MIGLCIKANVVIKEKQNLNICYHPLKIQTNCFGIIVSVLRPGNFGVVEDILVIT